MGAPTALTVAAMGTGHTSDPFSGSAFLFFGILSGGGKHLKAIAGRQRGGICCLVSVAFFCLRMCWKQPLGECGTEGTHGRGIAPSLLH